MPRRGETQEERFPECFQMTDNDPRSRVRTVPMEVLVIGMMRTGTTSMKAALTELGYNGVYHMNSVMQNPRDADMWREACEYKYHGKGRKFTRADWDQLLGHVSACCDAPSAAFMPELMEAYPEAKVIVSMRDPEKWYQSFAQTVVKGAKSNLVLLMVFLDPVFLRRWRPMTDSMLAGMFGGEDKLKDAEHVKKVYIDIHEETRRLCPKDRLLEFQLAQGWEPLCNFLDKPIPDHPFPRINESAEFDERLDVIKKLALIRVAKRILPMVGAVLIGAGALYFGLTRS